MREFVCLTILVIHVEITEGILMKFTQKIDWPGITDKRILGT